MSSDSESEVKEAMAQSRISRYVATRADTGGTGGPSTSNPRKARRYTK